MWHGVSVACTSLQSTSSLTTLFAAAQFPKGLSEIDLTVKVSNYEDLPFKLVYGKTKKMLNNKWLKFDTNAAGCSGGGGGTTGGGNTGGGTTGGGSSGGNGSGRRLSCRGRVSEGNGYVNMWVVVGDGGWCLLVV